MGKDLKGKELGEGIIQKKTGRYEARYVDRFGVRKSITGTDLKDVKRRFNEAVYENEKQINVRDEIKLAEWYDEWMNVYKIETVRKNTQRHYNYIYYKHIKPILGNMMLTDITQHDIQKLIKSLSDNGYGFETKNKVKILLIDIFNKALESDYVRKNPAKGVHVVQKKDDIRVLSQEEQVDFFDSCKGTFYDNLFVVAINTGMRIGELAGLMWDDVDFDKMVIKVRRTLVYSKYDDDNKKTFHIEDPKTYTSARDIPINKQCELALKKQFIQKSVVISKAPKSKTPPKELSNFLFTTRYNTPLEPQIVIDAIKKIVNDMNVFRDTLDEIEPFSCHCFRHTFATRCFEAGIKPKTIQGYLGHATLQMTMDLYAKLLPEYQQEEMKILDRAIDTLNNNQEERLENDFIIYGGKQKNGGIRGGIRVVGGGIIGEE